MCKGGVVHQDLQRLRQVEAELLEVERLNEIFWAPRAHHNTIKEGDHNTAFFDAPVKQHRKRDTIRSIRDGNRVSYS